MTESTMEEIPLETPVKDEVVVLDLRGAQFPVCKSTLTKYPNTMLGTMFSGKWTGVRLEDGSYFIDFNPEFFPHILEFYTTGYLPNYHSETVKAMDSERWMAALEFFQIINANEYMESYAYDRDHKASVTDKTIGPILYLNARKAQGVHNGEREKLGGIMRINKLLVFAELKKVFVSSPQWFNVLQKREEIFYWMFVKNGVDYGKLSPSLAGINVVTFLSEQQELFEKWAKSHCLHLHANDTAISTVALQYSERYWPSMSYEYIAFCLGSNPTPIKVVIYAFSYQPGEFDAFSTQLEDI